MGDHEKEAELALGKVLVSCRRRRRSSVWLDLGGSIIQLVLTPPAAALFLTLAVFVVCQQLAVPDNVMLPLTFFMFVTTTIGIYALWLSTPGGISLALHEHGLRYKSRVIPFAHVKTIRPGKVDSALGQAFQDLAEFLGSFHAGVRRAAAVKETSDRVTLTVILEDGRRLTMKNALLEYQRDDLEQFFDTLRERHPDVLSPEPVEPVCPPDLLAGSEERGTPRGLARLDLTANTRDGIDPTFGNGEARHARDELARGSYRPSSLLLQGTREPHLREFYVRSLQEWTGHPFVFETWKREEPDEPSAWLVSGAHLVDWAWQARSRDLTKDVDPQARATFQERLRLAAEDLDRSAGMDLQDPTPHAFQLRVAIGLGRPPEATRKIFDEAVGRCPDHYLAHESMVSYYSPRWHGSPEAMFRFAREVAGNAPEGSLLPAMIVQAHVECWDGWRAGTVAAVARGLFRRSASSRRDHRSLRRVGRFDPTPGRPVDSPGRELFCLRAGPLRRMGRGDCRIRTDRPFPDALSLETPGRSHGCLSADARRGDRCGDGLRLVRPRSTGYWGRGRVKPRMAANR